MGFEDERTLFGGKSSTGSKADSSRVMGAYQRSPSWFDSDTPQQDAFANSRANCGNVGRVLPLPWYYQPRQQGLSRLSLQSHSNRFELRRPLMEELELLHKEGDDDWLSGGLSGVDIMTPRSILTPSIFEDGMFLYTYKHQ
ncbi:hypothetical protein L7F22_029943 [Adiantum nelumboides]|nr:hypothetical protein [Adiantum nelumboides]